MYCDEECVKKNNVAYETTTYSTFSFEKQINQFIEMKNYYFIGLLIGIILLILLLVLKKRKILWIFLFCLCLIPICSLLIYLIYNSINGVGFMNSTTYGIEAILLSLIYINYQILIFIPEYILAGISAYNIFYKK